MVTAEPGGTPFGEEIRKILLHRKDLQLNPKTQALLFSAARAQFVEEVFPRALKEGIDVVISVRSFHSTLAYQGYGYGLDKPTLAGLTAFAVGQVVPNLVILLDLPVIVGLMRKRKQNELNRYEAASLDFHNRVRGGYKEMAKQNPNLWVVIDATRSVRNIHTEVLTVVLSKLKEKESNV